MILVALLGVVSAGITFAFMALVHQGTLEPLSVYGEIAEVSKGLIRAKAHIAKEDGTVLATGTSTFLKQNLRG